MRSFAAHGGKVRGWASRLVTTRHRERLVQAAKMALAAVVAWLLARQFHQAQSFIAPYVAVFLISQTIYRSVMDSARLLSAMVLGLVLAFTVITLVPQQVLALAIAVFVGMLVGQLGWLRDSGIWVGVVALLMVTSHTADDPWFLVYRVIESLIGAAVGTAINLLVLPPVHLRKAEQVVTDVSTEINQLLRTMAEGIRREWHHWETGSWLERARDLDRTVFRAREAVGQSYESTRFNPSSRGDPRQPRQSPAASWSAIDTLGDVARQLQRMAEALASANQSGGVLWPTDATFNARYADLLEWLAAGSERYRSLEAEPGETHATVSRGIEETERMNDELAARRDDEVSGWSAQGALLVAAERAFRALADDSTAVPD